MAEGSMAPDEAVNTYLVEHLGVCLEEVIAEASEGRLRPTLDGRVTCTAVRLDRVRDDDGAVCELYEGVLTLDGARYSRRASL